VIAWCQWSIVIFLLQLTDLEIILFILCMKWIEWTSIKKDVVEALLFVRTNVWTTFSAGASS